LRGDEAAKSGKFVIVTIIPEQVRMEADLGEQAAEG
jgi:hypothetical protein